MHKSKINNKNSYTDAFFVDKKNETVHWIYYNPDSNSGGQYVMNFLTFVQIKNVLASTKPKEFYDMLGSVAKQELADVGSKWFDGADKQFHTAPTLTGCTEQTRMALLEITNEPTKTQIKSDRGER